MKILSQLCHVLVSKLKICLCRSDPYFDSILTQNFLENILNCKIINHIGKKRI